MAATRGKQDVQKSDQRGRNYICKVPGCGKAFLRSEHLARHRLNHQPKQIFQCNQCPKKFVRHDLLERHQKRHENEYPDQSPASAAQNGFTPATPSSNISMLVKSSDQGSSGINNSSSAHMYGSSIGPDGGQPIPSRPTAYSSDLKGYGPQGLVQDGLPSGSYQQHDGRYGINASSMGHMNPAGNIAAFGGSDPQPFNQSPFTDVQRAQFDTVRSNGQPRSNSLQLQNSAAGKAIPSNNSSQSLGSGHQTYHSYGPSFAAANSSLSHHDLAAPTTPFHMTNNGLPMGVQQSFNNDIYRKQSVAPTERRVTESRNVHGQRGSGLWPERSARNLRSKEPMSTPQQPPKFADTSQPAQTDAVPMFGRSFSEANVDGDLAWLFEANKDNEYLSPQTVKSRPNNQKSQSTNAQPGFNSIDTLATAAIFQSPENNPELAMSSAYPASHWATARENMLRSLSNTLPEITDSSFFDVGNISYFFDLYFNFYHSHFPILHPPTCDPATMPALLLLSVITLGSTLQENQDHYLTSRKIHDRFRLLVFDSEEFEPPAALYILQTLLIMQAFEKMFSTRKHYHLAHIFHGAVMTLMKRGSSYTSFPQQNEHSLSFDQQWYRWVEAESSKRTAFLAFVMDAQHSAIFGHTPALCANDIGLSLPCDENLWNCPTATEWINIKSRVSEPPMFRDTLKSLLHEQPLPPSLSGYARFCLLHGLISVAGHIQLRNNASLGVNPGPKALEDGLPSDWRDLLGNAIHTWSFCLWSQTPSLSLDASRPLHRIVYIILHTNILDFHVFAGGPSLLGRSVTESEYEKAKERIIAWSSSSSVKAVVHTALLLVQETVFIGSQYKAARDHIALRPWALYLSTLVVWAYGAVAEPDNGPPHSKRFIAAEEYVANMLRATSVSNSGPIEGSNLCSDVLVTVRDSLADCRWELLQEAYWTLSRLIEGQ